MSDRFLPSRSSPLANISNNRGFSKALRGPKDCAIRGDAIQSTSSSEIKVDNERFSKSGNCYDSKHSSTDVDSDDNKIRNDTASESIIPTSDACKHAYFLTDSLLVSSIRPPTDEVELEMLNENLPFNLFDTLQKCLFSGNAPKSFYASIIANMKLITHVPESYILKYGEESKAFYILLKGTVAVTSQDGEAIHAELYPGAYFGEIGVLFCRTRTATVISKTKTLSIMITQNVLNSILSKFPQIERTIRDEAQKRLSLQDNQRQKRFSYEILAKDLNKVLNASSSDREQRMSIILPSIQKNHDPSVRIIDQFNNDIKSFDDTFLNKSSSYSADNNDKNLGVNSDFSLQGGQQISTVFAEESISDLFIPVKRFSSKLNLNNSVPFNVLYDFVLNYTKIVFYYPNELIFRKNDNSKDVYFILDGEVKILDAVQIYLETSELHGTKFEKVLAHLKKFDYFGEMTFINKDCTTRTADVIASKKAKLLVFPYDHLKDLCEKYPLIFDGFQSEAIRRTNANDEKKLANNYQNEFSHSLIKKEPQYEHTFQQMDSSTLPSSSSSGGIKWNSNFLNGNVFGNRAPMSPSAVEESYSSSEDSVYDSYQRRSSIASIMSDTSSNTALTSSAFKNFPNRRNLEIRKRRRSAFETPSTRSNSTNPFNLYMPLLNPPDLSPNFFKGQQFPSKFQYLNANKRLRIQKIGIERRRSSLLAYRPAIPDNILLHIFNMLDIKTLMVARRVCKRWRQILYLSPDLMKNIDLSVYLTRIDDDILIRIADFVGNRVETIDISNCFHVTDKGFSYLINEIGINGNLRKLKMRLLWHVSAMSIMDVASISVGSRLEEIDLSNCKRVRDDVVERLIGVETENNEYGSMNLARLNLSYCKYVTDRTMFNLATNMSSRLRYLNLQRCTTITDKGFLYWLNNTIPNLTELVLADCTFLTSYSISAIASSCPNLEKLDLSFCCALDEKSIDILNSGCLNLQVLNLSFCGNAVLDNSLLLISLMLLRLQKLYLLGCIKVTRAGVDILLLGCCPLKYLNIAQCRFAHVYPGGIQAVELPVKEGSRSSFITTSAKKGVVEIVL